MKKEVSSGFYRRCVNFPGYLGALQKVRKYQSNLTAEDRNNGDCYDAFDISGVMSIIFGLPKETIIEDIVLGNF